jgi:hypothetical protein
VRLRPLKSILRRLLTAKSLLALYGLLTDLERRRIEARIKKWAKR